MIFDAQGKLIITLLLQIARGDRDGIDLDLVEEAVGGNEWVLKVKYPEMFADATIPEHVKTTMEILDMWRVLSDSVHNLPAKELTQLLQKTGLKEPLSFPGFDGNNEAEHMSTVHILVHKLNRWQELEGKAMNSHIPTLPNQLRMLQAFTPAWTNNRYGKLALDDLINVYQAYPHQ